MSVAESLVALAVVSGTIGTISGLLSGRAPKTATDKVCHSLITATDMSPDAYEKAVKRYVNNATPAEVHRCMQQIKSYGCAAKNGKAASSPTKKFLTPIMEQQTGASTKVPSDESVADTTNDEQSTATITDLQTGKSTKDYSDASVAKSTNDEQSTTALMELQAGEITNVYSDASVARSTSEEQSTAGDTERSDVTNGTESAPKLVTADGAKWLTLDDDSDAETDTASVQTGWSALTE